MPGKGNDYHNLHTAESAAEERGVLTFDTFVVDRNPCRVLGMICKSPIFFPQCICIYSRVLTLIVTYTFIYSRVLIS